MALFFVCDESGAKGYSDQAEKYLGEAGVFAGYFIPGDRFEEIGTQLAEIASNYFDQGTKCHVADLRQSKQGELRRYIFDFIKRHNLRCAYDAIHVEGFKDHYFMMKKAEEQAQGLRRSRVKISNMVRPESLHAELFQGLFYKIAAFFKDYYRTGEDELKILVDKVDFPIMKSFVSGALEVTDMTDKVTKVRGWDPTRQAVVEGTIATHIDIGQMDLAWLGELVFNIEEGEEHLTMVADVVANSLNYLFKHRSPNETGQPLNVRSAIASHELCSLFYGLVDCLGPSDIFYMHPLEASRRGINRPTWI